MSDYSSSLTIQELSATGEVSGRQLILVGGGLPLMGADWSMKLSAKTTWYPGNGDEGTQQVLGPQEVPSHWNGDWRRTIMGGLPSKFIDANGDSTFVFRPMDLWDIFEAIARAGQRLRVIWAVTTPDGDANQEARVVREGRCTDLKFKVTRSTDIEWEATFDWVSRGKPSTLKVASVRNGTVNDLSAAYLNKLKALQDANTAALLASQAPQSLTLGQLEAIASYPTAVTDSLARSVTQLTSNVEQVVNIARTLGTQPYQVANRALDLAHNTISQTNTMYDTLSEIPYESLTTKSKFADLIRASKTFATQSNAARDLARTGQQFSAQLQQQIQAYAMGRLDPKRLADPSSVQRAYVAKAGDTPQRVSQRFYNSPDHAVDILRANHLPWHLPTLPAGKVLIIPALPTVDATTGA